MTGAGVGAALGLGEHILAAKRMAGLAKANTLVRDAMLNPELAMALLKHAPIKPGLGSEAALTKLLARNSMFGATTAARENNRPQQPVPAYARGGRIGSNDNPLLRSFGLARSATVGERSRGLGAYGPPSRPGCPHQPRASPFGDSVDRDETGAALLRWLAPPDAAKRVL